MHTPLERLTAALRSPRAILVVVWLASAAYTFSLLDRGWVPHDEGQLGQSAERVLGGEVPHRDFDEMYTGGLTYLNALALRLLGRNSMSMRLVLFAAFVATLPVVFYLASRWCSPLAAGGITGLCALWSLPVYPAPVPSWYNLFFAVCGLAAVFRHLETGGRSWLFLAGLLGGLSCVFKVIGVYYVGAVLVFLFFQEQTLTARLPRTGGSRWGSYSVFVAAVALLLVLLVTQTLRGRTGLSDLLVLVAPGVAIAVALVYREYRLGLVGSRARFQTYVSLATPFVSGVVLPVAALAAWYWLNGALSAAVDGILFAPQRRLTFASMSMPPFLPVVIGPALLLLAALLRVKTRSSDWPVVAGIGGALAFVGLQSAGSQLHYAFIWLPTVYFLPFGVLAVAFGTFPYARVPETVQRQQAVVTACVAATCSLTVFPYSAPIYFLYIAPLTILVLVAAVATQGRPSHALAALLVVFYAAFAVGRVHPGFMHALGRHYAPDTLTARLELPRSGHLRVSPEDAAVYNELIPAIRRHAHGGVAYAFPDAPEVYFLAGLTNPTRTIYEFLASHPPSDDEILDLLDARDVRVVAIKTPTFSPPASAGLRGALQERFPRAEHIGRFELRWRE